MQLKSKLENALIIFIINLLNLLPFSIAYGIGSRLGDLWYFIDKRRRDIALDNLEKAYKGEKSKTEILRIARGSFRNLCITIVEVCRAYASKGNWIEDTVQYNGLENVVEAQKKGKGLLVLAAHLGNWELQALRYGKDSPINFIARPLDNELLEKKANKIRRMYGNRVIYKKGAFKKVLQCLKDKETVGILIDQSTVREEGVFVDFFGMAACTTPVLAVLALRTGAPVIPAFNIRTGIGRHKIIIGKEVDIKKSGDKSKDIEYNTAVFTKIIESYVRKYPDQWLWMHRRWKTQPK